MHPSSWIIYGWLVLLIGGVSGCASGAAIAVGQSDTPVSLQVEPTPTAGMLATLKISEPSPTSPVPTHTSTSAITNTPVDTALSTPTVDPAAFSPPLSAAERQLIFTRVWQTVDENYLYADFRGVDWDMVWVEYVPRVRAVRDDAEFYALMIDMVGQLQDNHSRFLAPSAALAENAQTVSHKEHVGIGVITLPTPDGAIIQQVFSGSPAAQAGLKVRDRIIAVDGVPLAAGRDIYGEEGSRVILTIARPNEVPREIVLTRRPIEGRVAPQAYRLEGDIGYLAVTTLWIDDMDDQVSGALTDLVVEGPLNGVIIDLRGNPGGWRNVLVSVLGHFVQGNSGYFFDRHTMEPLIIRDTSGPDLRDIPLVVLIDKRTASYAEVLAAVLQAEADAYVIGTPSLGNTETIYAYELEDGSRLWVAQEGFRLRNGEDLEGAGVQPDLSIDLDWTRYNENEDPYVRAALGYLTGQ